MKRRYGWKPQHPDHRDFAYAPKAGKLPASVSPLTQGFPIFDQGNLGSCVANGTAALWQHRHMIEGIDLGPASRLFIYYCGRAIEGTVKQDSGLEVRDGLKAIAKQGACIEADWPYVVGKFKQKPPTLAYSDAAKRIALQYQAVPGTVASIKGALAAGNPVVGGFTVFESFESDAVAQSGIMPMPKKSEQPIGGHCVVWDGYTSDGCYFWCRNSWGTSWGLGGWFKMPVENLRNSSDFWALLKVE